MGFSWPNGLNLHILSEFMDEEKLKTLIKKYSLKSRRARIIILPSNKFLKKIIFYEYGLKVEKGLMDWDFVRKIFENDFGSLNATKITKQEMIRFYEQRKREIKNEK
jgi:hypothetical protein